MFPFNLIGKRFVQKETKNKTCSIRKKRGVRELKWLMMNTKFPPNNIRQVHGAIYSCQSFEIEVLIVPIQMSWQYILGNYIRNKSKCALKFMVIVTDIYVYNTFNQTI